MKRAFTLVELLVTAAIIAILIGVILAGTSMARKAARKARTSADMQTIATALEAYKQDFSDYPRLNYHAAGTFADPKGSANIMDFLPSYMGGTGAGATVISGSELLAWALVGPYDAGPAPYVAPPAWHPYDGKTGLGFRTGTPSTIVNSDGSTSPGTIRGQVSGPYLDPERFLRRPEANPNTNPTDRYYCYLHDNFRQPILYFARNAKPYSNQITTMQDELDSIQGVRGAKTAPYYVSDNAVAFLRSDAITPFDRFKSIMDERRPGGQYVLWSAGEDEQFSVESPSDPAQVQRCDDVLYPLGK